MNLGWSWEDANACRHSGDAIYCPKRYRKRNRKECVELHLERYLHTWRNGLKGFEEGWRHCPAAVILRDDVLRLHEAFLSDFQERWLSRNGPRSVIAAQKLPHARSSLLPARSSSMPVVAGCVRVKARVSFRHQKDLRPAPHSSAVPSFAV